MKLTSYIVTYTPDFTTVSGVGSMQFYAEDEGHAIEQFKDAEPDGDVIEVRTQREYEADTGKRLDYKYNI